MVVVQGGVAVLHVAVLGFLFGFFAFLVRLRLLFVATLVLDDVLPREKKKKKRSFLREWRG